VDWINPAEDRDKWWAVVNTVMAPTGFYKMQGVNCVRNY
jgi:hypothetical protein